jgi:flagellar biosynthesis/type III secretory pathway M-ring protein FliF/YscJ
VVAGGVCTDTQQTWESLGKAHDFGTQTTSPRVLLILVLLILALLILVLTLAQTQYAFYMRGVEDTSHGALLTTLLGRRVWSAFMT